MEYYKSSYPWAVSCKDKISERTGKSYTSTTISYKSVKDKNATGKDKYQTEYLNFFEPSDLLKLAALCLSSFQEITDQKNAERLSKPQTAEESAQAAKSGKNAPFLDDDVPF